MKGCTGRLPLTIISMVLALITVLSCTMTAFAWSDFTQSKTNIFRGTVGKTTATLHKYEIDENGIVTTSPVSRAEFELYKVGVGDAEPTKIGGTYKTDISGKITIEKLNSGSYFFIETYPGYGYEYNKNDDGQEIKKYPFEILVEDADNIIAVEAYNVRKKNTLELSKKVTGDGGDQNLDFEFTVTFSDGKDYKYKLNGTGAELTLTDNKLFLKHNQTAVFESLPVGVTYSITEKHTPGYITTSTNSNGTIKEDEKSEAVFTNRYNKDVPASTLTITKNVSGTLASHTDAFEFKVVFSDGGTYKYKINGGPEQSLTSGGTLSLKHGKSAVFTGVPVGISYTVTELSAGQNGYTASVTDMSGIIIPAGCTAEFLNHKDDKTENGSLEIKKTVTGTGADLGKEFEFDVTFSTSGTYEYQVYDKDGNPVGGTKQITGTTGVVKLKHNQKAVFTNLPAVLQYTVKEKDYTAQNYVPSATEYKGTIPSGCRAYAYFNNHFEPKTGKETDLVIEKKVDGEVPAEYEDKEYWFTYEQAGKEPERFYLKANDKKTIKVPEGTAYSIYEDDYFAEGFIQTSVVNGSGTVTGDSITVVFTNKFIGTIFIDPEGEKTWDMSADPSHTLPDKIIVHLMNGDEVVETKTVKIGADKKWQYSFRAPKYDENGKPITYTVKEEPISGYITTYDGMNIKNTFTGETEVSVTKVWDDDNNPDRPDKIHVQLYNKGIPQGAAVMLNAENNWTYTWTKLDSDGDYTVDELEALSNYTKTITGTAITGFTITNILPETPPPPGPDEIRLDGQKIWNHGTNSVDQRPTAINIRIMDGDRIVVTKTITEKDHWQWHFNLPKYRSDGKTEVKYTVDEESVPGYSKTINGYTIINSHDSHIPDLGSVTVSGEKVWNHGNSNPNSRPKSITVYIKNGDRIVKEITVSENTGWTWYAELPKYAADGSTIINYTIDEANVPKYTHTINGNIITNTYKSEDYPGDNPPQTGDTSNIALWLTITLISFLALVTTMLLGRKQYRPRYKRKH